MNEIYSKCDLQSFYQTGYFKILLIGIQSMILGIPEMKISILKESLLFISRIINSNSIQAVITIVR